jgi:diadenosine tetraphosphate (Ap4A) HIT family hydrolase
LKDARWPWLILVPRREGLVELSDLDAAYRALLIEKAARAALFLKAYAEAEKINVGALGNVVRQFHLHVVARAIGGPAWPGPVSGCDALRSGEGAGADRGGEVGGAGSADLLTAPRGAGGSTNIFPVFQLKSFHVIRGKIRHLAFCGNCTNYR